MQTRQNETPRGGTLKRWHFNRWPTAWPRLDTIFAIFGGLYGILLTSVLLMKFLVGEQLPIVALFNIFLELLLIPTLVLLPIMLLLRKWGAALLLIPAAAFFVVNYAPRFFPQKPALAGSNGTTLKLMTFNLHAEANELDGLVAVIRNSGADIVTVQELSTAAAQRFATALSDVYPYQKLHPQRYANAGQGVLSRYPLENDEYWRSRQPSDSLGNMRVTVIVGDQQIALYSAHPMRPVMRGLTFDQHYHAENVADVLERAEKESGPVLIMGDFNMTDQTEAYLRISNTYKDTYREVGWGLGPTFPDSDTATAPKDSLRRRITIPILLLRLDYIFHNSDFAALESHVGPESGGSDHHPLFATVSLLKEN